MKEIIIYQAYDGTKFDYKQECEEYEKYAFDMSYEITSKIEFIYPDDTYQITYSDLIKRLKMLEHAFNTCQEMVVLEYISDSAMVWLYNNTGIDFPNTQGRYKFNYDTAQWENVNTSISTNV